MLSNETMVSINQDERYIPISTVIYIMTEILCYLPLIFTILGVIGFLGNVLTFIQLNLRSNNCCIYMLCSSFADFIHLIINVFPDYLHIKHGYPFPWNRTISFLILSALDRFASTCSFQSPMHRFNQLGMVSSIVSVTILISVLASLYGPILAFPGILACSYEQPQLYALFNIFMNGIIPPIIMLTLVLLTYRNFHLSRNRVGLPTVSTSNRMRRKFIAMIITQVILTAIFSLQWMIGQTYVLFHINQITTYEQLYNILLILTFTSNFYTLNNIKSFYCSMITSRLYRRTFVKGLQRLFSIR